MMNYPTTSVFTTNGFANQISGQGFQTPQFQTAPQAPAQAAPQTVQPASSAPEKAEKKLNKVDIAAISAAAIAIATAGVCLYSTHKSSNLAKSLQQSLAATQNTLQKTQDDLTTAQDAISKMTADKQKMINNLLFPNGIENIEFQQSNVGDCYLLSSLYSLSKNKNGQKIIQNMVTITDDGNFLVSFNNMKPIVVKASELKGQTTGGGVRKAVYGDMGVQAIERAYGKHRKALLAQQRLNALRGYSMMAIDGGYCDDVFKTIAGMPANRTGNHMQGAFNTQQKSISSYLNRIADSSDGKVFCAATPPPSFACKTKQAKGRTHGWMDSAGKFPCSHAYSIANVDKASKTVTIVNPHDTLGKRHKLSYAEFEKTFGMIFEGTV